MNIYLNSHIPNEAKSGANDYTFFIKCIQYLEQIITKNYY